MDYESRDGSPRKKREKYYAREWEEADRAYQSPYEAGDYQYQNEFTQRMIAEDRYEARRMGMPDPHPYAPKKVQRKPESPFQRQDPDAFRHSLAYGDEWGIPAESQAVMREVLSKSGEPLGKEGQHFFESRMGEDFSDVRIHADADAARSAESIQAKAYTTGNDIVFGEGEYNPGSAEGKHLLAHELTHVVQQRGGAAGDGAKVQRKPVDSVNKGDQVINALDGITNYFSSQKILTIFEEASADETVRILQRLKRRAREFENTPTEMIEWLFDDLNANHREALYDLLIQRNVVADLVPMVVAEIIEEEEAEATYGWMRSFHGPALETLLMRLRDAQGGSWEAVIQFVFTELDYMLAEKLRQKFLRDTSPAARDLALHWTTMRIQDLLEGYTGVLDSKSILWNFRQLPEIEDRKLVLDKLQLKSNERIDSLLARKLKSDDYLALRGLGLTLSAAPAESGAADIALELGEGVWNTIAALAGTVRGIVIGLVDFAWDFLTTPFDLLVGAYHLFMLLLFLVSLGTVGSESVKVVRDYLENLGDLVTSPDEIIQEAYEDAILRSNALEGPAEAYLRADHWAQATVGFARAIYRIIKGKVPSRRIGPKTPKPGSAIIVTKNGIALTPAVLRLQGSSHLSGNFKGLKGASVEEIVSRVPAHWSVSPQRDGRGFKFIDEKGYERIRIHAPGKNAPAGSNSASGWIMRVQDRAENFYDADGKIVSKFANEGHIPIKGNPVLQ